jgi:hypothetical protein
MSDRSDAEGLAHLARTGWFTQVHIRSEASEQVHILIGTRERLIRMRKDLEAHVRGVLKTFGIRMDPILRSRLRQIFATSSPKPAKASWQSASWPRCSTRFTRRSVSLPRPWTTSCERLHVEVTLPGG